QGPDLDNVVTTIAHADGSTSVIVYSSQGHAALGKERVEAFGGGSSIVIDDFRRLDVHGAAGEKVGKTGVVQKGHYEIIENFVAAVRGDETARVDASDGVWATWCAHQALESLKASGSRHAG
ncbi:MAG TPA: hypothetical protein VFG86_23335, partial [Chloroflexota bacterium]|nr:hypothetical protein [Chloroflexota bacterium]